MSDWSQTLVDVEVSGDAVLQDAHRLTQWLIDTGVVDAELTDCVLGSPLGHPPGRNYGHAVGLAADAPVLWTNGVHVGVGPQCAWGGDIPATTCRLCGFHEELAGARWHETFDAAITQWHSGAGTGDVACRQCGAIHGLNDWDWGPYPWAFGELTVEFWNWSPLADDFVDEVRTFLGHRVVYTSAKL